MAKLGIFFTQPTKHDNFLNENVFCCFTNQNIVNIFKHIVKQQKNKTMILENMQHPNVTFFVKGL
jgi:bisphosphoglycerate-independent phosphoglycerate mutase (AlkP superfamily)